MKNLQAKLYASFLLAGAGIATGWVGAIAMILVGRLITGKFTERSFSLLISMPLGLGFAFWALAVFGNKKSSE